MVVCGRSWCVAEEKEEARSKCECDDSLFL